MSPVRAIKAILAHRTDLMSCARFRGRVVMAWTTNASPIMAMTRREITPRAVGRCDPSRISATATTITVAKLAATVPANVIRKSFKSAWEKLVQREVWRSSAGSSWVSSAVVATPRS